LQQEGRSQRAGASRASSPLLIWPPWRGRRSCALASAGHTPHRQRGQGPPSQTKTSTPHSSSSSPPRPARREVTAYLATRRNIPTSPPRPAWGSPSSLQAKDGEEPVAASLLKKTALLAASTPSDHRSREIASSNPSLAKIWRQGSWPPPPLRGIRPNGGKQPQTTLKPTDLHLSYSGASPPPPPAGYSGGVASDRPGGERGGDRVL
jgi:hypothetical protein